MYGRAAGAGERGTTLATFSITGQDLCQLLNCPRKLRMAVRTRLIVRVLDDHAVSVLVGLLEFCVLPASKLSGIPNCARIVRRHVVSYNVVPLVEANRQVVRKIGRVRVLPASVICSRWLDVAVGLM